MFDNSLGKANVVKHASCNVFPRFPKPSYKQHINNQGWVN